MAAFVPFGKETKQLKEEPRDGEKQIPNRIIRALGRQHPRIRFISLNQWDPHTYLPLT